MLKVFEGEAIFHQVIEEVAFPHGVEVFAALAVDDRDHRVTMLLHFLNGLADSEIPEEEIDVLLGSE